jgi:hypothetical protein
LKKATTATTNITIGFTRRTGGVGGGERSTGSLAMISETNMSRNTRLQSFQAKTIGYNTIKEGSNLKLSRSPAATTGRPGTHLGTGSLKTVKETADN